MAFLSLMSLGKAANQIGILPAELLKLGEDGVIKMVVVGSGPGSRHYLATGDVEELTTVVGARKLQDALLGLEAPAEVP